MEPEGSSLYSQDSVTCLYAELLQYSPCSPFHFLKIHFNIILTSMPGFSKWPFPLGFPTKTLYAHLLSPCVLSAAPILLEFTYDP